MNEISTEYNKILDDGVSITELYIYHLIVSDDRSIGMSEKNVEDLIQKVIEARYVTDKGLEWIVDAVLNGDEIDGDDEEWY